MDKIVAAIIIIKKFVTDGNMPETCAWLNKFLN